jgi:chromosome segregation ATPase
VSDLEEMQANMEELKDKMDTAETAIQDIATAVAQLEKERSKVCIIKCNRPDCKCLDYGVSYCAYLSWL